MKHKIIIVITLLISLICTSCTKTDNSKQTSETKKEIKSTQAPTQTVKKLDGYTQYQFDATKKYQTIDGFGAAYTWYSDQIFTTAKEPEKLLDALFSDAKMTILRFKNEYEYKVDNEALNVDTMVKIYNAAKERAAKYGEDVIVLMSCWSPPSNMKVGGDMTGSSTLIKDKNGNYIYEEYAKWWAESVKYYEDHGVKIDFVSIQNEPDFKSEWDGCLLDSVETKKAASYPKAYLATYHALQKEFGEKAPKMLGPETMSCVPETLYSYMKEIEEKEPGSIYGINHHLYLGGDSTDENDYCRPDSFMMKFLGYKDYLSKYKLWQTEFWRGHAIDTATVINNYLTLANGNAYIYWSGVWISSVDSDLESGELVSVEGDNTETGWSTRADYYAMRHFSEFIRPGYTRIDTKSGSTDVRSSAFISKDGKKMAVVLINRSKNDMPLQINSTGYTIDKSTIYQSIVGDSLKSRKDLYKNIGSLGKNNEIKLPAGSITTIDISGTIK